MSENSSRHEYRPATVSPPGQTIGDLLEERELRQAELATRMGVTPKFVNELVAGKASITPPTALALERALDVPAEFWLAREAKYQESRARAAAYQELSSNVSWLNDLPLKDMIKFKWLPSKSDKPAMVETCLQFFGVASVDAWRQQYVEQTNASAAYRASEKFQRNPGAVAAWLRRGEVRAAQIECKPFDRDRFLAALNEARQLTLESDPAVFLPRLTTLLADCGVALVIERAPSGCPLYGAVRWLSPQKALIQLSVRYLRSDSFWFTFFHECGHIALHGKKILFLEGKGMSGTEEDEADRFAADRLIPAGAWATFQPPAITEQAIREFARSIGIDAGIVLGRLQNDKRVPWNRLDHLKARYKWKED
jgi:HTH-type transcriptional regulator / antitoxin HigA